MTPMHNNQKQQMHSPPAFDPVEPFDEMALLDEHERDMFGKLFDPDVVPKVPNGVEEGVTQRGGTTAVDMMHDTPAVEVPSLRLEDELQMEKPVIDIDVDGFTDLEPDL